MSILISFSTQSRIYKTPKKGRLDWIEKKEPLLIYLPIKDIFRKKVFHYFDHVCVVTN